MGCWGGRREEGEWEGGWFCDAIMQRLGPGRRAKHLEVQTMWVQQLAKIGLISLNKLNTLENVADLLTKHVEMMGHTFPGEETQTSFRSNTSLNQNCWNHRIAAVEGLPVFDDGENESLEDDVRSFVDKPSHLTATILRRCVELNIQQQPFLHRPPLPISSRDNVGMTRTNREV